MLVEAVTLLTSTVGGKFVGMISDALSERRVHKHEEAEREHQRRLSAQGATKEHIEVVNAPQPDGSYSPMSYVSAYCVGMFATVYCIATLTCFFWGPEAIVFTKDPTEEANKISLIFGLIEWDIANNRVISMSKIGLGFLMVQPIIFIVTMVLTGDKARKRH